MQSSLKNSIYTHLYAGIFIKKAKCYYRTNPCQSTAYLKLYDMH